MPKLVDPTIVGKRLVKLRGAKSREEVAKSNGISVSAIQMYENGLRIPRDEIKLRLSVYYGVGIEEIFFNQ